jgi:hypothetical protein
MDKKEEEKFVWYKAVNVWLVIILLVVAFANLFLGNPLGR